MGVHSAQIRVSTEGNGDIIDITKGVQEVVETAGVKDGIVNVFVSHSTGDVKAIADRVMWLDHGRMVDTGDPELVISKYLAAMVEKDSAYLTLKEPVDRPQAVSTLAPEIHIPNVTSIVATGRPRGSRSRRPASSPRSARRICSG